MMAVTDELRSLILHRAPSHELRKVATKDGMSSLRGDGWRLVREGKTTIDEIIRNTKDEEGGSRYTAQTPQEQDASSEVK